MTCAIGCRSRVVGVANLVGLPGSVLAGFSGSYPLCQHHYGELLSNVWGNVKLIGWEALEWAEEAPTNEQAEVDPLLLRPKVERR